MIKKHLMLFLKTLPIQNEYGSILRAKGMLPANDGTWMYFDLVPEEYEIRGEILIIQDEFV